MLVVVDKVEPWHRAEEEGRVSALAGGNALEVRVQPALAVEGLASLDLGDHFPHVQVDFSCVFGGAVESNCLRYTVSASLDFFKLSFIYQIEGSKRTG